MSAVALRDSCTGQSKHYACGHIVPDLKLRFWPLTRLALFGEHDCHSKSTAASYILKIIDRADTLLPDNLRRMHHTKYRHMQV